VIWNVKEGEKELMISAVTTELRRIKFKNKFQEEDRHDLYLTVSVMLILKEEGKQFLDRKIVNEAEERMELLLKAKRL